MVSNLHYTPGQKPKKWYEWILYPLQMVLAVIVATILIAQICGTPITSCLVGAGIGTLCYQVFTKFKSPMFISSCGATASAVIGALALGGTDNYIALAIGGVVIFLVYLIFALIVKFGGISLFNKIFPVIIIGPITMVIGLNLAAFIPTYIGAGTWSMIVALVTMFVTALCSHYFKGFMKTIAFLIGLVVGYLLSVLLTITGTCDMIKFGSIDSFFALPDFAFLKWANSPFSWSQLPDILLLFTPVSICAVLEHYSDHKCLSNILGTDLTENPGLSRTLIGDGIASMLGTVIGAQPNTSYGESVATIGFSKVASVIVTTIAAAIVALLGFIAPVRVFLESIPSAVFGGSAIILYGYIAASGLRLLIENKTDLSKDKNLLVVSVVLTTGVSGVFLFSQSFTGVALAMVIGVILNLILRTKSNN